MKRLGDLLDNLLQEMGLASQIKARKYLALWQDVVGKKIGQYTRPLTIKDRKLVVEVSDSIWLHHLSLLKSKIVEDLNRSAGFSLLDDIQFINTDFRSLPDPKTREIDRKAFRDSSPRGNNFPKAALKLDEKEEKLLLSIRTASSPLHGKVESLMRKCMLQQKWKWIKGATSCGVCGFPFFAGELKEELCALCFQQVESWIRPLQIVLHRQPWLNYEKACFLFPTLDEKIFSLCKGKILEKYFFRIKKVFADPLLEKNLKKKILKRLTQRYVLIQEEKEPDLIAKEEVFKSLKVFPGLYQFLYGLEN